MFHSESLLYGAFVRARRALSGPKRRFPARAVVGQYFHAHLLGRSFWSDLYQMEGGDRDTNAGFGTAKPVKKRELGRDRNWLFDNQHYTDLPDATLSPGEVVSTVCVYNSKGLSKQTRFGLGTRDEMCLNFLYYWPAVSKTESQVGQEGLDSMAASMGMSAECIESAGVCATDTGVSGCMAILQSLAGDQSNVAACFGNALCQPVLACVMGMDEAARVNGLRTMTMGVQSGVVCKPVATAAGTLTAKGNPPESFSLYDEYEDEAKTSPASSAGGLGVAGPFALALIVLAPLW